MGMCPACLLHAESPSREYHSWAEASLLDSELNAEPLLVDAFSVFVIRAFLAFLIVAKLAFEKWGTLLDKCVLSGLHVISSVFGRCTSSGL